MLALPLSHTHAHAAARLAPGRPIVGVDDAGVGAIAGPVFAAAVLLPTDSSRLAAGDVVDSKTLSLSARRAAFEQLCATPGLVWATASVHAREVDTLGGHAATAAAMRLAVARLEARLLRQQARLRPAAEPRLDNGVVDPSSRAYCLVDGPTLPTGLSGVALPGGDGVELSIAAASIVAVGARDAAMRALARRHPLWQLGQHGGHANAEHMALLREHGPCPEHRLGCFPFARRFARRMSYHPHRSTYTHVQAQLGRAADPTHPEPKDDQAEAARLRRYRELLAAGAAAARNPPQEGSGRTAALGRRARRRRRQSG